MYILSGSKKEIINSDFVERFCLSIKDDATLIVASYSTERPPVTLGRYADLKEAQGVLNGMMGALVGGQIGYDMPESLLYAQELAIRDARIKRKGGS